MTCYTSGMKNTTGIKKPAQKAEQTKVRNYRLWLVLSSAGLIGVWYVLVVLGFLGSDAVILSRVGDVSPELYGLLVSICAVLALFLASAVSVPVATAVFKRLKIQAPLSSAIAFFMAPTFGVTLFALIMGTMHVQWAAIGSVLTGSMIIAGLVYGLFIRPLKHRLSNAQFLLVAIGLAVLPCVLYLLYRLLVTVPI